MNAFADTVRARLAEQAEALARHAHGARTGADPEHVHQLRVAVRRARAVLRTAGTHEHLQAELKWLAGVCGDVRDADVLLDRFRASSADFADDERACVGRLLDGLARQRRGARRHMLAALRGARLRALLASLDEAAAEAEPAGSARKAADAVTRPRRTFAKALGRLDDDPPDDDLHRLRIKGKRLRYAAELVRGKRAKKVVKAAKKVQNLLGEHQDAVVAEERLRALVAAMADPPADVALVAGRLIERERARRADCRARWRASAAALEDAAGAL